MKYYALLSLLLLASCAATGPLSAPVMAGAAAVLTVLDQLLSSGVIDQVQHYQMSGGIKAMGDTIAAVQQAQGDAITTQEAIYGGGGVVAAVLGAVRALRGPADKGLLVKS